MGIHHPLPIGDDPDFERLDVERIFRKKDKKQMMKITIITSEDSYFGRLFAVYYDREKRALTINGETKTIPKANDAPKKEILLDLLCREFYRDSGVPVARYREALAKEGFESSDRTRESAIDGLNQEIEKAFGIKKLIRRKNTMAIIKL